MILMAIDASTKSSGVAIFKDKELIHYECITSTSTDVLKRIKKMTGAFEELYKKYNVDRIVAEDVLPEDVHNNQSVFNALHYLQASFVLMFHNYNKKVELINVNTWRRTCGLPTGRNVKRDTAKENDMTFVKKVYNIDANDDICDAICLGWASLNQKPEKTSAF